MPSRAPSRCPCGVVTPAGSLCPCRSRQRQASRIAADARRPSSAARGYGSKWTAARIDYLAAHQQCARCGAAATVVHHVVPHRLAAAKTENERAIALKLFWRRSNWRAACQPCHDGPIQSEERRDHEPA